MLPTSEDRVKFVKEGEEDRKRNAAYAAKERREKKKAADAKFDAQFQRFQKYLESSIKSAVKSGRNEVLQEISPCDWMSDYFDRDRTEFIKLITERVIKSLGKQSGYRFKYHEWCDSKFIADTRDDGIPQASGSWHHWTAKGLKVTWK